MAERTRILRQEVEGIVELAVHCKATDRLNPELFDHIINSLYPSTEKTMDKGLNFISNIFESALASILEDEEESPEEEGKPSLD